MIWLDTEYLDQADETIQTVIVGDDRVVYVHYYNGYYSLIEGVNSLLSFMAGDCSERFACTDNEEKVEEILKRIK